ncbi:leucine-rich repeat flightless-interacting protein 2 isoform X3 [Bradysia coprophila]|nr:leucine-rich repeat flightless-interacting protein 2 isoform X3 [Bradysia coprophila]
MDTIDTSTVDPVDIESVHKKVKLNGDTDNAKSVDKNDSEEEFDFSSSDLEDLDSVNSAVDETDNFSEPLKSNDNDVNQLIEAKNDNIKVGNGDAESVMDTVVISDTSSLSKCSNPISNECNDQVDSIVNTNGENSMNTATVDRQQIADDPPINSNNIASPSGPTKCEEDGAYSDEDGAIVNFLGKANEIAESRLAQRRQARAEAREIRMRELERQQKEQEQNADRVFDMQASSNIDPIGRSRLAISSVTGPIRGNSMSSRRSSEDSLEEEGRSLRDIRHELKDVEERFRKAMIANAQLDNERASQSYQIQLLKDKLEEMEEAHAQLQREHKDKCRDHDALKRNNDKLADELKLTLGQLNERDTLIAEQGLAIVIVENDDGTDARRALVSVENAQLLDTVQGSLDVRLKKFAEEKQSLKNEVQQLHQQLLDSKTQRRSGSLNGPLGDDDYEDVQREANKQIADYRYKLQKAEQEIASLQASLARSETQVIRYKSTADAAEKAESELKLERRKLQRENREVSERLEELETANNHLLKRLDKLKNAKSALLKDL